MGPAGRCCGAWWAPARGRFREGAASGAVRRYGVRSGGALLTVRRSRPGGEERESPFEPGDAFPQSVEIGLNRGEFLPDGLAVFGGGLETGAKLLSDGLAVSCGGLEIGAKLLSDGLAVSCGGLETGAKLLSDGLAVSCGGLETGAKLLSDGLAVSCGRALAADEQAREPDPYREDSDEFRGHSPTLSFLFVPLAVRVPSVPPAGIPGPALGCGIPRLYAGRIAVLIITVTGGEMLAVRELPQPPEGA